MASDAAFRDRTSVIRERMIADLTRFLKFMRRVVRNKIALAGLIVIVFFLGMALIGPILVGPYPTPLDKDAIPLPPAPPDADHPLGTDRQGYDILTLLVYGSRVSLLVGFSSAAVAMLLGTFVGIVAGYYGRAVDEILARTTDFFLVIPWLPFVIILGKILGPGLATVILAISIVSWPTTARIVRSQVLSLRERLFVERARGIGAGDTHILLRHILPNVMPLVFAQAVLTISSAVFTEAFLSFFGLGPPGMVSWGVMIEDAYETLAEFRGMWWYFVPPGVSIVSVVLGFSMLSYALEEILNPRLRKR